MASQNLNVGTAANANDGDTLRAAFINVRKMFHEIYGITAPYADDLNLSAGGETFAESVQDIIGGMVSGNTESNITVTYDDTNNKLNFSVAADITDVNAGDGLSGVNESGGAATLSLDLNELTSATVDVAADSIAIVDASDSNASRKETIADVMSAVAGSGLTATNGVLDVSVGTNQIANDAVDGTKLGQFDDSLSASNSGDILVSNGTDFIQETMSGDATIATGGALTIGDNKITHDKLENRYTARVTSSSTGSQNLNCANASSFELTGNIAASTTLTLQNMKIGQSVDILFTGTLTNATSLTLDTDFTTDTIYRVGDGEFDTSTGNLIQVTCLNDSDSEAKIAYSVTQFTVDNQP